MSASSSVLTPKNKSFSPNRAEVEERKGLLNDTEEDQDDHDDYPENNIPNAQSTWSRRKITMTAIAIIGLLVTGTLARTVLFGGPGQETKQSSFSGEELRSNGTAQFKRTVLIVSIDGLRYVMTLLNCNSFSDLSHRADYLDRGLTPHLLDLSKKGLRAKSMKPIFPVSCL